MRNSLQARPGADAPLGGYFGYSEGSGGVGRARPGPARGTGTCPPRGRPGTAPASDRCPPPGSSLYLLPALNPRGDLLKIKSAATAVQSTVPGSKGEDNVLADLIGFLLLQSLLITLYTAHHTAILQAPDRAPRERDTHQTLYNPPAD